MKDLTCLKSSYIAHRGLFDNNNGIPENSIIAFKKAIRNNYAIELDVHLTKDKKLVVFHDNNLKRICGVNRIIEDLTYEELLKYNLLNTKYKIPLFSEVLNLIDGKVFLLIETKVFKFDGMLEEELAKVLDNYKGLFAIQSFNIHSIYWFKKNRPEFIRGLLSSDFNKWDMSNLRKFLLKSLISDIFLKTDFISYDIKALPNIYISNKRKKKPVLAWTVRDKKNFNKSLEYADNIIFENIDKIKSS